MVDLTAEPSVKPKKLSELVVARIKRFIIEHSLGEGDRLPTEHDMAEMFGVSRISIREATKALSFLGIIRSAPRRGLTVGRVDMERVTEYLGFHFALAGYPRRQLLQTRIIIETGALEEAMERVASDAEACRRLLALNAQLVGIRDADEFIRRDLAFHRALLELSGIGPLLAFSDLLEVFFVRFREQVVKVRKQWSHGIASHGQIVDALRNRDIETARRLLRQHLDHYKGHL